MLCLNAELKGEPLVLCSQLDGKPIADISRTALIDLSPITSERKRVQVNYWGPLKVLTTRTLEDHPDISKLVYDLGNDGYEGAQDYSFDRIEGGYPILIFPRDLRNPERFLADSGATSILAFGRTSGKFGDIFKVDYFGPEIPMEYEKAMKIPSLRQVYREIVNRQTRELNLRQQEANHRRDQKKHKREAA